MHANFRPQFPNFRQNRKRGRPGSNYGREPRVNKRRLKSKIKLAKIKEERNGTPGGGPDFKKRRRNPDNKPEQNDEEDQDPEKSDPKTENSPTEIQKQNQTETENEYDPDNQSQISQSSLDSKTEDQDSSDDSNSDNTCDDDDPEMNYYDLQPMAHSYTQNSLSNYAPSTISYVHNQNIMSNSHPNSHPNNFPINPQMTNSQLSNLSKSSQKRPKLNPNGRPSSPTNSTSQWSIGTGGTSATFKNDLRESHYNDMFNEFRENDLNNMERNQILQEYFFMERVNGFLSDKLFSIEVKYKDVLDKKAEEAKKAEEENKESKEKSEETKAKSETSGIESEKESSSNASTSTIYTKNKKLQPLPLTPEQILIEKELLELGLDPVNDISDIKDQLEMIELQVEARTKQLDGEKSMLQEGLDEAVRELEEISNAEAEYEITWIS